jgi:hypothetical protein
MKCLKLALLGALVAIVPPLDAADTSAPPPAQEIMKLNFFASKLRSLRADSTMVLVNDKGQRRERRSLNTVKLQANGIDSRVLVRFSAPATTTSGSICRR